MISPHIFVFQTVCMFSRINSNLRKNYDFEDLDLVLFDSYLELKRIPKKTIYYRAGERNNYLSFVTKGILKAYITDSRGNEIVLHFPKEDWWVGDFNSFHFGEPASVQFETIEDCELLCISSENMHTLVNRCNKFESAFNILMKRHLASFQTRYVNLLTLSAKERFEIFAKNHPDILQRVPQKSIASYVGVTPEFLSKMRAERE